jgi:hypothetical protein
MLLRAFRANLFPALVLWGFAFALLGLYSLHFPTQMALDHLAKIKQSLGLGFSMPAQAVAAGLLPFFYQKWQRGDHRKTRLSHVPFLMLAFAFLGGATDLFYGFQAQIFGDDAKFATIALKTALDMLVYTPLFSVPMVVLTFAFKDNGFSPQRTRAFLGPDWITRRVWPLYVAALVVWTPTVAVLYALPLALQFPFQAIVQCFWGLILVIMTDK